METLLRRLHILSTAKTMAFFLCTLSYLTSESQQHPVFPLQLSETKRYLEDQSGNPFLIKEFSAWGLIQALSEAEESAFLDSIKIRGFNTVMTSILSNATGQMAGNPPYWQGVSPLEVEWDFSTPNEEYFRHVDRFFKMAEAKGIFVMALPFYMGYRGDGAQGWWDELINPHNSPEKMRAYGEFIGKRYQNTPNLMFIAGGDNNTEGEFYPYQISMMQAIKTAAPKHLWTGHFDTNKGVFWSTANPLYADFMDIDGQYVWTESNMLDDGPQYVSELKQYQKGKMIIQLDQSYEHDVPHYADNENPQWIRRKMYEGLLNGCAGTSFSSGVIGNQCYTFKNWKPLMNTSGMMQVAWCFQLFDAVPWHNLVPDQSDRIILTGRGEFGSLDYICAAQSQDQQYYIMYIPKGRPIFINMKNMSETTMRMHWYNPRSGAALKIGATGHLERFGVVPPSEEDWVLVFDSDDGFNIPNLIE